jgi:hypothetical protein
MPSHAGTRCTYCRVTSERPTARCPHCGAPMDRGAAPAQPARPAAAEAPVAVAAMTAEQLRTLLTMPSGRRYSYWLDGSFMTGRQRVRLNAAARRLRKLEG